MSQLGTHTTTDQRQVAADRSGRINRLAVWGLVLAILMLGGIGSVLGIVMGAKARRQVAQTGERGAGIAVAAIVVGVLTLIFAIGYWVVIAQHVGGSSNGQGGG